AALPVADLRSARVGAVGLESLGTAVRPVAAALSRLARGSRRAGDCRWPAAAGRSRWAALRALLPTRRGAAAAGGAGARQSATRTGRHLAEDAGRPAGRLAALNQPGHRAERRDRRAGLAAGAAAAGADQPPADLPEFGAAVLLAGSGLRPGR